MAQVTSTPGFGQNFVQNLPTVSAAEKYAGLPPNFIANVPSGGSYGAYHPGQPPHTAPYKYTGQAS